jgi:transcriptional regulator with XRE-family HTH domain
MDNSAATTYPPVQGMVGERSPAARTDPAFRNWLRQLRERAGLTQDQLAAAVGTDRRNIRRWEIEGHDPAGTVLLRILDAVGVELAPKQPSDVPGAVNAELRDLQALLYELEDRIARQHDEVVALLEQNASATRARRAKRATASG